MNESALIDDKIEYLAKTIMGCIDIYAPKRKVHKLTLKQSWITNEINNLITKRDALFQMDTQSNRRKPYSLQNNTQQGYPDDKDRRKPS